MNVLARKTCAAAAISVFPPLLLIACSHAAKPVPPPVTLGFCGSNPQTMPDVVLVVCNTNDITARNLIWSDWESQPQPQRVRQRLICAPTRIAPAATIPRSLSK
jgi:hypothetical protein